MSKEFDCVEMKYALQRRMLEKWRGLSDDEIRSRFEREIESSNDPLARWWKSIRDRKPHGNPPQPLTSTT